MEQLRRNATKFKLKLHLFWHPHRAALPFQQEVNCVYMTMSNAVAKQVFLVKVKYGTDFT